MGDIYVVDIMLRWREVRTEVACVTRAPLLSGTRLNERLLIRLARQLSGIIWG